MTRAALQLDFVAPPRLRWRWLSGAALAALALLLALLVAYESRVSQRHEAARCQASRRIRIASRHRHRHRSGGRFLRASGRVNSSRDSRYQMPGSSAGRASHRAASVPFGNKSGVLPWEVTSNPVRGCTVSKARTPGEIKPCSRSRLADPQTGLVPCPASAPHLPCLPAIQG